MVKIIVFTILSLGLILLFWNSLRQIRSHGFYVFLAFESILGLCLINAEYWFQHPFSVFQIVSWLLLLSSVTIAVQGFYLIHEIGKPKHGIEDTSVLVTKGIYKHIRHPLYSSLLLLGWGIFFKNLSLLSGGLVLLNTAFLIAASLLEESENIQRFGADYKAYMMTTRRFIPFLI